MKLGTENKKQLYALVALAVLAVILILRFFFSSNSAGGTPEARKQPNTVPAQPDAANRRGRSKGGPPLDPTLRTDLLKNSEESEYRGSGRNIFEARAEIPEPSQSVIAHKQETQPQPVVDPGPPPPPPIPLKFYGFANRPGQPKSVFLANGDDIFIGHEGDIVNRRYKIVHIMSNQVEIEDVQNNHHEAIPLTQGAV